jgi:YedE family putative selenium metabolism protein
MKFKPAWMVLIAGAAFGILFSLLIKFNNPPNMGVCVACFTRDIAGALKFHSVEKLSYVRPEIIGFIIGSCIIALFTREFKSTGGSSPIIRFLLGMFMMIGALVFLGCPTRMCGRLAGGDWTAVSGIIGIIAGIFIGSIFLKKGFTLGRAQKVNITNGLALPVIAVLLLIALFVKPEFIRMTGTKHAVVWLSIGAGLLIGILGQRSRLCFAGGIRDLILMRDMHLLQGVLVFIITAFAMNLILGQFVPGKAPIAHANYIQNFLGMALVGLCAVLLGGCPFRQTIMAGKGSADAGMAFLGMLVGAGFAHNFALAAKPMSDTSAGGIGPYGWGALVLGLVFCLVIGFTNKETA